MRAIAYTLFDTAIGNCGIAWGERGLVGRLAPGNGRTPDTRPPAPPAAGRPRDRSPSPRFGSAIEEITALLAGDRRDLSGIALDLDGVTEFSRRVYAIARTIPPGRTLTYGEIATQLGDPLRAREVGQALARNPFPIVVPCHRVLAANGKSGGFSAPGGVSTKLRMLEIEGARGGRHPDALLTARSPRLGGQGP